MRIAHIITRLLRAGSEENTLTVCEGQSEAGHEVFILHGSSVIPEFAKARAPNATLVEIPALQRNLSLIADTVAYFQLRAALRSISPDVVHTHQSKAGILGRLAASALDRKKATVVHGVHILPFLGRSGAKRILYLTAERFAARYTDLYIHVSEGMKTACETHRVGMSKPHRIVCSGFDLDRFAKANPADDSSDLLKCDPSRNTAPILVMLAALEPRKQHLKFLDTFANRISECPDLVVLFAGEGPLESSMRDRIEDLGLQRNVRCLGYRSDPERLIAMADLCVLCSENEGLPRSVLQYLAGGRAPVVFYVDGIESILQDNGNGRVVENGNWNALFDAIFELARDNALRLQLSHGARQTDLSAWDAGLMSGRTLEYYAEVMEPEIRGARP